VKNDKTLGMVIDSGWRVVHIILKIFCCFLRFFAILNLPSVFRHSTKFLLSVRKKYSAKNTLPIKCLPSIICRVLHLTKVLPSVTWPLPIVWYTRQRKRVYRIVSRFTNFIMWMKRCICASGRPHGVCPVMMWVCLVIFYACTHTQNRPYKQ
jgi:hypothetical protein